jgi:hypothetical protein
MASRRPFLSTYKNKEAAPFETASFFCVYLTLA